MSKYVYKKIFAHNHLDDDSRARRRPTRDPGRAMKRSNTRFRSTLTRMTWMTWMTRILTLTLLTGFVAAPQAEAADHRLGVGALFYTTVDDVLDDGFGDIEEDGYALVLSYRYEPEGIFWLGLDAEYYESGYGGATDGTVSPIVFLGVGHGLYAAVGLGFSLADEFDDNISESFWAGRVGWQKAILPGIAIDINLNYRADAYEALGDASTDAINLGATLRFRL